MDVSQEIVDKIQRFAQKRQKAEEYYDQQPITTSDLQDYNRKLDDTLRELQDQVNRQEDELRQLRTINSIDLSKISTDSWARISQVRRAKKAYDSLLKSENGLPNPGSPLPSLLAINETSQLIRETKSSVFRTAEKLSADRQRLKVEEANLRDAQLIRNGLEKRIERIREEKSTKNKKSPSELAHDLAEQQQEKNKELEKAAEELKNSLHKFVDDTLASMLAAEDLGGPTVGNEMEISDAVLEAGYTSHGKPKKPKSSDEASQSKNQQRIDELLRRQAAQEGNEQENPTNKREAAAAEMHALLDDFLDAGSSYINLPRESAASRFLVRAKVAQFHPRDAKRLRLIDFGRSLIE